MGVRNMQGTPSHLETLRTGEKKRRDKRRCKFYTKPEKVCDCVESPYFEKICGGSSRCDYYQERG